MIAVHVLYFAGLRELRGRAAEDLQVPEGTTLEQLYRTVFGEDAAPPPVAFARNAAVCRGSEPAADGDEIAFLPPLGGG